MKKLGRVTILTLLIIILSTLLFVACDKDGAKGKQVPVYKGMTISSNFASASATTASDDNGNHYGHFKGDHNDRDDDVDQNKPFEDPNAPSIENKANSTLDVVGAAESIYYADKNQDIFITIRLSNPDSYEILSFTLNGKKYSNYMFEDGSDMENLVLKVNVGNVGGIHDYTIDAIKYVDGTDIKDVRMDGDKTVKAGVRASDQTYVTVTNEQKTMTSISFDAQVVDSYSLIEKSGGYAKVVLYDGETMIAKDVTVGEKASVVFDNLTPNTVYQYGVVALYDDLSGNGVQLNILYKKAVYTDTIVLFKDVQVGKESIEWGFVWNESFANKQMSAISLWQNGAKVQDVDVNATSVDGLKSNNEYTLKATYKNIQNQDETISIEFVTYAKATPGVTISNLSSTQNTIECDIAYTDVDGVGRIESVVLFKGETQVATTNERTHVVFDTLESDTEYTLVVTYKYDLNDGKGEQTATQNAKRYTAPQFEFVEATCANTSAVSKGDVIYFEATVVNPSGVAIERIKINDRYYTPSGGTTKNSIIVNITVEDQFEGGNTELVVSEIEGTLHGQNVSIIMTENNTASVFVNGDIFVKSIHLVDEDGNECEMVVWNKTYYYKIILDNKTGYQIKGFSFDNGSADSSLYNTIIVDDINTIRMPYRINEDPDWFFVHGAESVKMTSIEYGNSSVGTKTKRIQGIGLTYACVRNETPISITSVEQLKAIRPYYYYVLENDIDLEGIEWSPVYLDGIFDGQGHTIKNMNYAGTVKNSNLYWGLFGGASGIIKNLSVSGRLMATITADDGILMDSNIGQAYVGGICGRSANLILSNVVSNVNLSVTNETESEAFSRTEIGGFVGDIYNTLIIIDSVFCGSISAEGYVGGFVGYGDNVSISNTYNSGTVNGGVNSHYKDDDSYGDSVAGNISHIEIKNCYFTSGTSQYGGEKKTLAEIIEIMKTIWDSTIWDFDNLDENGNPALKLRKN